MAYRHILVVAILSCLLTLNMSVHGQDETAPGDPNVTIHVVQRGETLFRIAMRYELTTDEIARANGLTDPSNIQVGQRLIIPIATAGVFVEEVAPVVEQHIVRPGESLVSIANLYELTTEELAAQNGLADPSTIFVGQILIIRETAPQTLADTVEQSDTQTTTDGDIVTQVEASDVVPGNATTMNSSEFIHVIQAGQTLFSIATQYGLSVAELQQANGIVDPTRIFAGQELVIPGIEVPRIALDLPPAIASIDLKPLRFTEGRTGRVSLSTTSSATVTGVFLGQSLTIIPDENATQHTMLIGVPLFTEPGIYPLELTIIDGNNQTTQFALNVQVLAGGYSRQTITLPDGQAELLNPGVEENELNVIRAVTERFTSQRYFDGPMSLPAAAVMNAPYGLRRSYNGGAFDRFHSGADFAGAPGSPILAAAGGQVVLADTLNIRGISVIIDHGWGVYTNYSHMSERYVQLGEVVTTGQTIGLVGNTGRATGAHLHWELWVNGVVVDPMQWVIESFP